MIKRPTYTIAILISIVFLAQCKHDPSEYIPIDGANDTLVWPTPSTTKRDTSHDYFENDILKLIVTKCAPETYNYPFDGDNLVGCHSREHHQDNVILDNYNDIIEEIDREKNDPNNSDLYTSLFDPDKPMPAVGSLTQAEQDMIKDWIISGSERDSCNSCDDYVSGSFIDGVAPILYDNCSGCHNNESFSDNYTFFDFPYPRDKNDASYNLIVKHSTSILASLREINKNEMPKYIGRLYECEYKIIKEWVDNGMPNN